MKQSFSTISRQIGIFYSVLSSISISLSLSLSLSFSKYILFIFYSKYLFLFLMLFKLVIQLPFHIPRIHCKTTTKSFQVQRVICIFIIISCLYQVFFDHDTVMSYVEQARNIQNFDYHFRIGS